MEFECRLSETDCHARMAGRGGGHIGKKKFSVNDALRFLSVAPLHGRT